MVGQIQVERVDPDAEACDTQYIPSRVRPGKCGMMRRCPLEQSNLTGLSRLDGPSRRGT